MKVLYKTHYIGRDLFIIEKDNKVVKVYRSSGLSGTGHEGQIIPFSCLNSDPRDFMTSPGYIFKEMLYGKRWMRHRKEIYKYPEVEAFMKEISELVKDTHPRKHKTIKTKDDIMKLAKRINTDMDKITEGREYLNLKDDIEDYLPTIYRS